VKSKQNQLVKRIEQNEDLSEEEKEALLRAHEGNLGEIDRIMA